MLLTIKSTFSGVARPNKRWVTNIVERHHQHAFAGSLLSLCLQYGFKGVNLRIKGILATPEVTEAIVDAIKQSFSTADLQVFGSFYSDVPE